MATCSSPVNDAQVENPTGPNWLELPRELTARILTILGVVEILQSARYVCPLWWNICKEPLVWSTIHIPNLLDMPFYRRYELEKMLWHAIDLSRGHLQYFNFPHFCSDDLLEHAVNSTNQLRWLGLSNYWSISRSLPMEVVNKLPLLVGLDISLTNLGCEFLETVGRCCPCLSTLKFNQRVGYCSEFIDDDEAFAVGKTMVNLSHLAIVGNTLSNNGLLAILEGCSRLEFLDLRGCFNVDLGGSLRERCNQQIKCLLLPDENIPWKVYRSLDDLDFDDPLNSTDVDDFSDVDSYFL